MKNNNREQEGLQLLGKKTEYRSDYAPEVLETFQNKHPENDYWVQFNCPEFTSLCPITGQPARECGVVMTLHSHFFPVASGWPSWP